MELQFYWQVLEKCSNIKSRGNPSSGSGVVACGQTDRHDEAKLTVAFRNSAYKPTGYCWEGCKIWRGVEEQLDSLSSVEGNSHMAVTAMRNVQILVKHSASACNPLLKRSAPELRAGLQSNHGPADWPLAAFIQAHHHIPAPKHVSAAHKLLRRHTPGATNRHVPDYNTLRHATTRMGSKMSRVPIVLRRSVAFLIFSKKRSKSKVLNSNSAPSFHVLPDPLSTYSTEAM